MKQIFKDLLSSFKTNKDGFSSRKLTAFVIVVLAIVIHVKWLMLGNLTQLEMVLTIDYAFISALFGMTTFTTINDAKNKAKIKDLVDDTKKILKEEEDEVIQ